MADITGEIEQHKEHILRDCLAALDHQEVDTLVPENKAKLLEDLSLLYHAVFDALEGHDLGSSPDLCAWAEQRRREDKSSLSDLLNLSFAMRTAFRDTILQSAAARQAVDAWKALSPIFDQMVDLISRTYTGAMEQTLTEHLQESEYLTTSLVQATEEADKALIRLRSIYDISQALGTSLSDTEQTLNRLAQELGRVLKARHCAIWFSDVEQPYTVALYAADHMPFPVLPENVQGGAFGAVLRSAKSQILTRDRKLSLVDEGLLDSLHASSLLLAPLVVQEIPIGVVTLGRREGDLGFDSTEMTLVESVMTQAAVAIQNAGLYEEIRDLNRSLEARVVSRTRDLAREKERFETLYAIGQELGTSLDLDQVLEKTLHLIARAVGATYGAMLVVDPARDALTYVCQVGDKRLSLSAGASFSLRDTSLAEPVLKRREPVLIHDLQHDEHGEPAPGKTGKARSLMAAPLVMGEDIYGVLLMAGDTVQAFDQDQQKLVIASAQQIAQAMKNAQLYGREQEEHAKTQAVLQSIADGVIVNDTQGKVIVFNAAAESILDTQEPVLGQDVQCLFDVFDQDGSRDAAAAMEAITSSPLASEGRFVETTLELRNKVVSAHMASVVTDNQQVLGVVTVLRDITREVEADRAKSEFVSTVSHELRTPLTSIKGYTDLIHAGAVGPVTDPQRRFLGIIKSNADRLTALINDLLDISRIESGRVKLNMEPQSPTGIVLEVADSLREQIEGKGLAFELDVPEHAPDIMGDRVRLGQIVTNLLSNAIKYTDEGWIRVSLCPLEGAVRLDVADSGIGISTEDQGKIFERFYRADTPVMDGRGGTGLGLAITKELVELHGGRLWVKSEIGVGSTFTVILPTAAQDLPPGVLAELPAGAKKILVVDDERDILALLRHQLTMQGYQVLTASTGGQAITKAIDEQPDLITLDILLPDRHGFDVLRELKARSETAHIPVIVLSVVQDESNGYRLGAVDYIIKPIDEQRLLSSVSGILSAKGKILIAEDAADTAELLSELLSGHGYDVLNAVNGYETLALADRENPDMILLDLRMPGMDGYEALTRLKKDPRTRSIPILVMSAHAADPVQERLNLQAMGAEGFLPKPLSLEHLLHEVERVVFDEGGSKGPANGRARSGG